MYCKEMQQEVEQISELASDDRLQGDWHAVRGSESRAAVMESSPALPFPQSRGKSVDKVGGGVYNVSGCKR